MKIQKYEKRIKLFSYLTLFIVNNLKFLVWKVLDAWLEKQVIQLHAWKEILLLRSENNSIFKHNNYMITYNYYPI